MTDFVSYAQNFEDVMLWRALRHVEKGFYIDLGAQDPLIDSVSLAFHERGWTGIHVEPTPHYAQMLRAQRPGDIVLEAAVGNEANLLTIFEVPDSGISTADPQIAQQHRERGFAVREITVPCVRLSSIFKTCGKQDIHWLKIDVEGFEWSALTSWGKSTARPWIVVVESTLPMTQIESHQQWESLLLKRGYTSVYFDGLNRYYVSQEKAELEQAFYAPPNVFDNFSVNGTASTSLHRHLKTRHAAELMESAANAQHASSELAELKQKLSSQHGDFEQAYRIEISGLQAEVNRTSDLLVAAKQEFADLLQTAQKEAQKAVQVLAAREVELAAQATARERVHLTEILASQAEVVRTSELLVAAKDQFVSVLQSAQQETIMSAQMLATREREFSALASAQEYAHRTEISSLQAEVGRTIELLVATKDEYAGVLHVAEQEALRSARDLTVREREFSTQAASREQEFSQMLTTAKQEFAHQLDSLRRDAEGQRLALLSAHRAEVSDLKQALLIRERDFSAQTLALHGEVSETHRKLQIDANNSLLQLTRAHDDLILSLNQSIAQREYEAQTRAQDHTIIALSTQAKEFLQSLDAQHTQSLLLQNEIGTLRAAAATAKSHLQDMHEDSERLRKELSDSQIDNGRLERAREAVSTQLIDEREHAASLQETAIRLKQELERHHGSLSWRLTAPLRGIFYFFSSNEHDGDDFPTTEVDTKRLTPQKSPQSMKTIPYAELAIFNGEQFIENCYWQLLQREADLAGKAGYLSQLEAGVDKATLIEDILRSDEGRRVGVQVTNFDLPSTDEVPDVGIAFTTARAPGEALGVVLPMKKIPYADLASFSGEKFIENCYWRLLHREADPSGRAGYLSLLEAGVDKATIIEDILRSDEGRGVGEKVGGLWSRSIQKKLERWPFFGILLPIQTGDTAKALRAINNKLYRLIEAREAQDIGTVNSTQDFAKSPTLKPHLLSPSSTISLVKSHRPSIFIVVDTTRSLVSDEASFLVRLGKAFLGKSEAIYFVYWNVEIRNFQFVTTDDLYHLELAAGLDGMAAVYPINNETRTVIEPSSCGVGDWLVVPEMACITPDGPQLLEMDMIMEARRLGLGAAYIFHGAEPLRLKKFAGRDADIYEQYMQALLLADAIIPVSTLAANDLKAFFVQHQKADSGPLIEAISLPAEGHGDASLQWSDYAMRMREVLIQAADKSHHLVTLYYWVGEVAPPSKDGRMSARRLAGALTECGIALIPVVWNSEEKRLIHAEGKSDHLTQDFAPGSWAEWIQPGHLGAPKWVFLPDEASGELLAEVTAFAKSRHLRTAAILPDAVDHRGDGDFAAPTARDRFLFEALAGIDKVFATSEHRSRQFHRFLLSWRGKVHSAEHRFKMLATPNEAPGLQQRSWGDYAKEIVIELATDRLTDGLRAFETQVHGDVYATLVNLRTRPKLSLCISTYNRAGWVEVNLRNIFSQIGPPRDDLEVLVVDNTSVDHTPDVVQTYLARSDFRYVRNLKNVGMLGNLAVTAQRAKGEYVWIIGDDDLTRPGIIERVLQIINQNPDIGLIYMNYGYTSEANPGNVTDLTSFLTNYNTLEPACPDEFAPVKSVAAKCENFFTAIYSHVYRRDHALKSYCQDTSGRIFSTMLSCVPTAYYVLNYMADEPAYWIGEPSLVVNSNVSWQAYGVLLDLEQLPRTWDLAERMGTPPAEVDRRRANRLWLVEMMWKEIFENDKAGNSEYFSALRVLMRLKHLPDLDKHIPEFIAIYERARVAGHPAAIMPADELFTAFSNLFSSSMVSNQARAF